MKKKLFLFAFCAIFSIADCLAQGAESFEIEKKTLKEGKNLIHSTPTMEIYAIVKSMKIVRVYGVDNTSKNEREFEALNSVAKEASDGSIDMEPICYDCPPCPKPKPGKKRKCPKCKVVTCPETTPQ